MDRETRNYVRDHAFHWYYRGGLDFDKAKAYADWYVDRYSDRDVGDMPSHRDAYGWYLDSFKSN